MNIPSKLQDLSKEVEDKDKQVRCVNDMIH